MKQIRKRNAIFSKIKRTSLVIFLRKILFVVITILIIIISFLLGLWDVKEFEYLNTDFNRFSSNQLDSHLSQYKGENIFLINPLEVEDLLITEEGYIKEARVEKILPGKLRITISEHIPFFAGYYSDRCILFSSDGTKINNICEECEKECFELSKDNIQVYIVSDSLLESSNKLIFLEEIKNVTKILDLFGYCTEKITIQNGLCSFEDDSNHTFTFDLAYNLDVQLARLYLVCQKIDNNMIQFSSLDLRFERPVMRSN
jgi:hypothetical protein